MVKYMLRDDGHLPSSCVGGISDPLMGDAEIDTLLTSDAAEVPSLELALVNCSRVDVVDRDLGFLCNLLMLWD